MCVCMFIHQFLDSLLHSHVQAIVDVTVQAIRSLCPDQYQDSISHIVLRELEGDSASGSFYVDGAVVGRTLINPHMRSDIRPCRVLMVESFTTDLPR